MTPFRIGLGHVVLDFLATLGNRAGGGNERLATPSDLDRWLAEVGLVGPGDGARPASTKQLSDARELREAIYRIVNATRDRSGPAAKDVELVNGRARRPVAAPQIGDRLTRTNLSTNPVTAAITEIARASVELVTGADLLRVRQCEGCSLPFIDRSRPGRRRWCSMDRCGNRSKTARYRAKRA
jgi:predicted RNA-binding Zn ribbon-like protein